MAAMNDTPRLIDAAGITVELRRGGSGTPLLVIHGELGVPGWLESLAHLAEHYDVIVPSLPGYGRSTRPDWVMSVHDLAAWVTWFAGDVDLEKLVPLLPSDCQMVWELSPRKRPDEILRSVKLWKERFGE